MKRSSAYRFLGILWLLSLISFLFLGLLDFVGGPPAWQRPACTMFAIIWVISGLLLVVWYACSLRGRKNDGADTIQSTMPRWLAAVAGGSLGGLAACLANHLFPGTFTARNQFLAEAILMAFLGMPVGCVALVFSHRSPKVLLLSFSLSLAVSWLIISWNFR